MKNIALKGFTLIELAVALTIVALVIGGLAVPMSKRLAEQQYIDTQANIDKAIEALVGYAILNRRLPCPDVMTLTTDNRDGFEDIAGAVGAITGCSVGMTASGTAPASNAANYHSDPDGVSWGDLPWQTLGLGAPHNVDAWNNRLRYAVFTPLVTQAVPAIIVICSNSVNPPANGVGFQNLGCNTAIPGVAGGGQIDIRCGNPTTTTAATVALGCLPIPPTSAPPYQVTQSAVFVVYSMGANGFGSTSLVNLSSITPSAFTAARTATYPDEAANAPELDASTTQALASALRRQFVTRTRTDGTSTSSPFDDLLSFVSASTLAAKLSNAGVWP